jgi:hypothetical protein
MFYLRRERELLYRRVQTGKKVHPASYSTDIADHFSRGEKRERNAGAQSHSQNVEFKMREIIQPITRAV